MAWNQWSVIRGKLQTFLKDTDAQKWGTGELMDFANWAMEDLVRFRARRVKKTYPASETTVAIPEDFHSPLVVQFPTGQFIEEVKLEPGVFFYSGMDVDVGSLPMGWHRDDEYIYLLSVPDDSWHLHYYAYYPELTGDNSIMKAPRWFVPALIYYASACAVLKEAIGEANINRWNTRRDSGKPTDNPLVEIVKMLYGQYLGIVTQHSEDESPVIPIYRPTQRTR